MPIVPIAASALGDNTLVAAVTGKRIRVRRIVVSNAVATGQNVKLKSGAATDLTGLLHSAAVGVFVSLSAFDPMRVGNDVVAETAKGEALVLNLSAATAVGGLVDYALE